MFSYVATTRVGVGAPWGPPFIDPTVGLGECFIPPWDYSWETTGVSFSTGEAIVAMVYGDDPPTDDGGNTWTEVASFDFLHCYVCLGGGADLALGDKVYVSQAFTAVFFKFDPTYWSSLAPNTTLDGTPVDWAGDFVSWVGNTPPLTGFQYNEHGILGPIDVNYRQMGYIVAMISQNDEAPYDPDVPSEGEPTQLGIEGLVAGGPTNWANTICYGVYSVGAVVQLPPGYSMLFATEALRCPGDISLLASRTNPPGFPVEYLLVGFKLVESEDCDADDPDDDGGYDTVCHLRESLVGKHFASVINVDKELTQLVYDYSETDTLEATNIVDTEDCRGPNYQFDYAEEHYIFYKEGTDIKLARSANQGDDWTLQTLFTGYNAATACWAKDLEGYELLVIMLYNAGASTWYVSVGTFDEDGVLEVTTPVAAITGAAPMIGSLLFRSDGVWEFMYKTTALAIAISRCPDLGPDGSGTWD